jgi:hypothetical protein
MEKASQQEPNTKQEKKENKKTKKKQSELTNKKAKKGVQPRLILSIGEDGQEEEEETGQKEEKQNGPKKKMVTTYHLSPQDSRMFREQERLSDILTKIINKLWRAFDKAKDFRDKAKMNGQVDTNWNFKLKQYEDLLKAHRYTSTFNNDAQPLTDTEKFNEAINEFRRNKKRGLDESKARRQNESRTSRAIHREYDNQNSSTQHPQRNKPESQKQMRRDEKNDRSWSLNEEKRADAKSNSEISTERKIRQSKQRLPRINQCSWKRWCLLENHQLRIAYELPYNQRWFDNFRDYRKHCYSKMLKMINPVEHDEGESSENGRGDETYDAYRRDADMEHENDADMQPRPISKTVSNKSKKRQKQERSDAANDPQTSKKESKTQGTTNKKPPLPSGNESAPRQEDGGVSIPANKQETTNKKNPLPLEKTSTPRKEDGGVSIPANSSHFNNEGNSSTAESATMSKNGRVNKKPLPKVGAEEEFSWKWFTDKKIQLTTALERWDKVQKKKGSTLHEHEEATREIRKIHGIRQTLRIKFAEWWPLEPNIFRYH